MTKSKGTTEQSLIAILSARLTALYTRADAEGFRAFTDAENVEADAITTLIAFTPAVDRNDNTLKVAAAREILELWEHGMIGPKRLEIACAALASA